MKQTRKDPDRVGTGGPPKGVFGIKPRPPAEWIQRLGRRTRRTVRRHLRGVGPFPDGV